jgi:hypothetical protein
LANAIANNKLQAYFAYYDASGSASSRKYKYAATSDLGMDASSLEKGRGYWVYSNEDGILTLPNVNGTKSGESYLWGKLRFMNSSGSEMNVTEAGQAEWIESENIQYYDYDSDLERYKFIVLQSSENITPWKGYFIYSEQDNITLIRQN